MIDQKRLPNIISQIECLITDVQHQADCIDGEVSDSGALRLSDMWDCNDMDNWTSMEANLKEIKEYLENLYD